jgi:biopolymer transport protein ExbD
MHRKAVVLLLYQITRSLRLPVLTICCVAGTVKTTPSLTVGLLPQAVALSQEKSASVLSVKPNAAIVAIPNDGEFYFGKVRVNEADIPDKIKQALKDKPPDEQIVYIKAASFVRYGTVVSVIDAIRAAGFDQIGLVADKKKRRDVKPKLPDARPANKSSGSSDAASLPPPGLILIEVRNKTRVELNSQPMLLTRLGSRLQELLNGRSIKSIFIKAPRKMIYGDVMKVIDIAKGAGAYPIGLQVDQLP